MTSTTAASRMNWFNLMKSNLEVIKTLYPLAFPAEGQPVKPLKNKVADDLVVALKDSHPDITPAHVQHVLGFWCTRRFYLKSFKAATHRIDLAGQPVEEISEASREHAMNRLDASDQQRAKAKAKSTATAAATPSLS
jgi:sRNA-binding protein